MARLQEYYENVIRPALVEQFGYKNEMAIPRLEKIVLNASVGETAQDRKKLDFVMETLAAITGQKPLVTKARKSIAGFKLRKGMPVGAKVTLRGNRMYEFLDRFITIAMPRLRDFRGISRQSGDGRGNLTIGVKEHIIFPEVDYDRLDRVYGMDIVIVTTAKTDLEAIGLLSRFGIPFQG